MYRRALLSTGVAVAPAGCFGFGSGCPRSATLDLSPASDADVAAAESDSPDSLSPPECDAIDAARRDESPTMWTVPKPFSAVDYVAVDGTYYAVETAVESTAERPGYVLGLDTDGATAEGAVPFDDLPATDRAALFAALGYPGSREMARYERARSIGMGGTLASPTDDAEARSELVPDPSYDAIRIAGRAFRIEIGERRRVTVEQLRVGVRAVATTAREFATLVDERSGIDFDSRELSVEQRDIVETAIDEGDDECAPYSDAFADLQETLGWVGDTRDGVGYANYDDEWYAVDLFEAVA
ncbi:MAG: hypothetical protein V5A16_01780 [Haloplanus sp.]